MVLLVRSNVITAIKILSTLITVSLLNVLLPSNSFGVTFPDSKKLKVSDAPFLISFWSIDESTFQRKELYCSGVLIDKQHFLTAAHCLDDLDFSYVVVAATTDLKDRGQSLVVTDVILHPRYDRKTLQNDIAIGRLYYPMDTSIRWGTNLKSFPIIPDNDKKYRNDMRLFGWGDAQNSRISFAANSIKQNDYTKVASKVLKNFNDKTMLGAGYYYKNEDIYGGACYGDSGGPLVNYKDSKTYLIGITSYGSADGCDVKKPTSYTRTAFYRSWVQAAKKEMLSNWIKRGISVQNYPVSFSLPNNSSEFLAMDKDEYGSNSYVLLNKDPDTGRADIESLMFQVYKDSTLGINLYFSKPIDGCLLRQKGYFKLQISKNSYQEPDGIVNIKPASGCFKNDIDFTSYNFKTPPNDFGGSCSVNVKPFSGGTKYPSTEIHQIAIQFNSKCLGTIEKLWVRANLELDDGKGESDVEPGLDMWVGPFKPRS